MFKPSGERRPLLNRVNRPPRGRLYDSGTVAVLGAARSDASPSSLAWNIGESTLQSVLDVIRRQCGYVIPWVDFLRFKPSGERHPLFKRKCHSPRGPLYDKETAAVRGAARSAASPHLAAEESASGRMSRGARRDLERRILEAQAQRRASRGAEDIAPTSPPFDAFERSGCVARAAARSAASPDRALLPLHHLPASVSVPYETERVHAAHRVFPTLRSREEGRAAPRGFPSESPAALRTTFFSCWRAPTRWWNVRGARRAVVARIDRLDLPRLRRGLGRRACAFVSRVRRLSMHRACMMSTLEFPRVRCWADVLRGSSLLPAEGLRSTLEPSAAGVDVGLPPASRRWDAEVDCAPPPLCKPAPGVDRRRDPRGESVQRRRARLKSVRRAPRGARHASVCLSHEHSRGRRQNARRAVSLDGDVAVSSPLSALQRTKRGACVVEGLVEACLCCCGPRAPHRPHSASSAFAMGRLSGREDSPEIDCQARELQSTMGAVSRDLPQKGWCGVNFAPSSRAHLLGTARLGRVHEKPSSARESCRNRAYGRRLSAAKGS
ncbi:hypothetical protein SCP_0309760 [Sparassis crispa]|uniref:Uncharacterized protein n=1 Tax=Sparassis crispa TaxID=139825 RepID=A0A401GGF3_9APHY|nr:hypothetical protein SCP_0309760 [Sparassis crispa]GBE81249.1 hypothetical protein SCP_0309760 [Sparassis crispa]